MLTSAVSIIYIYIYIYVCVCVCVCVCVPFQALSKMVVKSELTLFSIPELEFEIPAGTQKGQVTTVDSILLRCVENLEKDQPHRMVCDVHEFIFTGKVSGL